MKGDDTPHCKICKIIPHDLTDEDGTTADFVEESHSILHGVLVGTDTEEESEHEEAEEEELTESHGESGTISAEI